MEGISVCDWGVISYEESYERQKEIFENAVHAKMTGKQPVSTLILCEHPPVFTIGKHGLYSNLLSPDDPVNLQTIPVFQTDRGGDVTYHGPGQLVVYPVLNLEFFNLGLKRYIYQMEEVVIRLLASFGIKSERFNGAAGVWIDTEDPCNVRKICAIGVRCSRFITMHGLALNVNTDLHYFNLINPCGFTDKGVTSMEKELGNRVDENSVKKRIIEIWMDLFVPDLSHD